MPPSLPAHRLQALLTQCVDAIQALEAQIAHATFRLRALPPTLAALIAVPWALALAGGAYLHLSVRDALRAAEAAQAATERRAAADSAARHALTALARASGDCAAYLAALESEAVGGSLDARERLDALRSRAWMREGCDLR